MFLLDIRYDPKSSTITKWIKDENGCKPVSEVYYPGIYISQAGADRPGLKHLIASLPGIRDVCAEKKSTWLGCEPEDVLCATIDPGSVYDIASMLEAKGLGLYNVDLDPVRQYTLRHGLIPMAKLRGGAPDDEQYALDYEVLELTIMKLSVTPERDSGITDMDDPIRRIDLGDTVIGHDGEAEMLESLSREILLLTMEAADSMGFEILHGIVDSLWVKGQNPEKLCEHMTQRTGIPLELKGEFRWIVFLPNRSNGTGALNRYYGVMSNGRLKVRGIEMRRGDTPRLISNLQEDMLGRLAEAKDASGFCRKIPEAVQVLKGYAQKLEGNECSPADLVFKTHVSRGYGDYRQFNNQAAALMQYRQEGIEIQPGQSVRYIITDHMSKSCQKRVKIPELADGTTGYDRAKYYEHLLRAAESILLPFGYTEKRLDGMVRGRVQRTLYQYPDAGNF